MAKKTTKERQVNPIQETVDILVKYFVNQWGPKWGLSSAEDWLRNTPELTKEDIQKHIAGDYTIAIHDRDEDGLSKWFCLDIDCHDRSTEAINKAVEIKDRLRTKDKFDKANFLIEQTGTCDDGTPTGFHVWALFEKPTPVTMVQDLAKMALKKHEVSEVIEIFPKGERAHILRLPLGRHMRGGLSHWIDGTDPKTVKKHYVDPERIQDKTDTKSIRDIEKLEWKPRYRHRELWPCLEHAIHNKLPGDGNVHMLTLVREMWLAGWSLDEVIEAIKTRKGNEYDEKKTLNQIKRFLRWANKEEDLNLTSCKKLKEVGFKCFRKDCLRAEIKGEKKESVASRITNIVEEDKNITLFSDDAGRNYAWINREEHKEVWPIDSRSFKKHLARMYRKDTGVVPSASSLRDATLAISAIADETGKRHTLHNRVAWYEDSIWYDMSNEKWEVIRVDKKGWEILPETPIPLFIRIDHQLPQIEPARNDYSKTRRAHHIRGKLLKIMRFHNLQDRASRILDIAHLVFALVAYVPHPVTNVHGPAGCGKTKGFHSTSKALIDPSIITEGLPIPRKNKKSDLVIQLNRHYYVIYTNLSYLDREMSDAICRAVDGTGDETRKLYTNEEIVSFRYQRSIGLNAIPVVATQEDLMDRSLLFGLSALPREERMDETEIQVEFEKVRPEIFGAMLDTLSAAMSIRPNISLGYIERLGEFTKWGCAIAESLGYEHKEFLEAYADNRKTANEEVIISSLLGNTIMKFMEDKFRWEGTPTELHDTLTEMKYGDKDPAKSWPGNESWMSRDLARIEQPLYRSGLNIERSRAGDRTITISWCDGYGPVLVQDTLPEDSIVTTPTTPTTPFSTVTKLGTDENDAKLLTYENGVVGVVGDEKSPEPDSESVKKKSTKKKPSAKKKSKKKVKVDPQKLRLLKQLVKRWKRTKTLRKNAIKIEDEKDRALMLKGLDAGYVKEVGLGWWFLTQKVREKMEECGL